MARLDFWFAPGSSSMAPHIALHEVGADFTPHHVSFARSQQREPAFRALNPEGKVPLLLIDGRPLTEVAGILTWVGRAFPDAGLWPAGGAEEEAQAVSWMSFIASTIHPARRQGPEHAAAVWALAEQKLGGREWAVGNRYSVADIHLFRLFWRFGAPEPHGASCPALMAHHARMMARRAVQRVIEIESALGYELPV